jgi:hypothetical protein
MMRYSKSVSINKFLTHHCIIFYQSQPQDIHRSLRPYFGDSPQERRLLSRTEECFYRCVALALTGDECKQYIQGQVGYDLSGHEIPLDGIKIHAPRTPEVAAATSNLLGIPTNMDGQVLCTLHDAVLKYPKFQWETAEGTFGIPVVNCAGIDAVECCDSIKGTMEAEGIPLIDINGKCLSCWVHQELLEPSVGDGLSPGVVYKNHTFDGTACTSTDMTQAHVEAWMMLKRAYCAWLPIILRMP